MNETGLYSPATVDWAGELLWLVVVCGVVALAFAYKGRSGALGVARWFAGMMAVTSVVAFPRDLLGLSPDGLGWHGFWLLAGGWLVATRPSKVRGPQPGPHHERL